MQYRTISEIYEANDSVRTSLKETLARVSEQEAVVSPELEKWSIAQIVEHLSIVGNGMYRICAKLLSKAEAGGEPSDGGVDLTSFAVKAAGIADVKLEAPEIVRPTGAKSIAESLASLDRTEEDFRGLKSLFEKYPTGGPKFPHPYLGDMTAVEWLTMYGEHEKRHLRQIEGILEILDDTGQKRAR